MPNSLSNLIVMLEQENKKAKNLGDEQWEIKTSYVDELLKYLKNPLVKDKGIITKVRVERLEGRTKECYATDHKTIGDAESRLWLIATTAPDNGGYDKTRVIITFEDGEQIETRHDVKKSDIDGGVLEHARKFLRSQGQEDHQIFRIKG